MASQQQAKNPGSDPNKPASAPSSQSTPSSSTHQQRQNRPAPERGGTLARYGRSEPFQQMRDEFDRLFNRFFSAGPAWPAIAESRDRTDYWGLDLDERDDAVVVRAEAPGFEPGDFDLQVRGNQLFLCACHEQESDGNGGPSHWQRQELCRTVTLPAEVSPDKVDAHYRNGVLTMTLPKVKPSASSRIAVHE